MYEPQNRVRTVYEYRKGVRSEYTTAATFAELNVSPLDCSHWYVASQRSSQQLEAKCHAIVISLASGCSTGFNFSALAAFCRCVLLISDRAFHFTERSQTIAVELCEKVRACLELIAGCKSHFLATTGVFWPVGDFHAREGYGSIGTFGSMRVK
jgi:hypothetical protein